MAPMVICEKCGEEPATTGKLFCADCQSALDATRAPPLPPSQKGPSEAAKARTALAEFEKKAASERADRVRGGLDAAAVLVASAQRVGNVETNSDLVRAVLKGAMVDDVDAAIRALVEVLRCLAPERVEGV